MKRCKHRLNRTPSWAEVQRHYRAALRSIPARGRKDADGDERIAHRQSFLRKVSAEFHRRLKRAGIYVEGVS